MVSLLSWLAGAVLVVLGNTFDSLFEARSYADDAAWEEGFPTAEDHA